VTGGFATTASHRFDVLLNIGNERREESEPLHTSANFGARLASGASILYEPADALVTWAVRTEEIMRAEIQAAADDISKSLALLRRHL